MKKDTELGVIAVVGTLCLTAMVLLFPPRESEASEPYIRDIEYQEYHPYIHSAEETTKEILAVENVVSETTTYILSVTDEERALMERVVMSEGSILPIEGKQAIAQTIINRVRSRKFPNNVTEVINQPYQYSTADNGIPNKECAEAVEAALTYEAFPTDMYYFRTGHYHSFADDYCKIGNTYFSTERDK